MTTIQTKDSDGSVVQFPVAKPLPKKGYTIRENVTVPPRPAGDTTSVLRWQGSALAWVSPAATPASTYAAAVAAGYTVPGITPALVLSLAPDAESRFTSLLVLINAKLAASAANASQTQVIFDCQGAGTVLTYAQLQTILVEYGDYSAGLLNTLHAGTTTPAS